MWLTSLGKAAVHIVLFSSRSKFISVPTHGSLMNVESPGGLRHTADLNLSSSGSKVNCQVICFCNESGVNDCCNTCSPGCVIINFCWLKFGRILTQSSILDRFLDV